MNPSPPRATITSAPAVSRTPVTLLQPRLGATGLPGVGRPRTRSSSGHAGLRSKGPRDMYNGERPGGERPFAFARRPPAGAGPLPPLSGAASDAPLRRQPLHPVRRVALPGPLRRREGRRVRGRRGAGRLRHARRGGEGGAGRRGPGAGAGQRALRRRGPRATAVSPRCRAASGSSPRPWTPRSPGRRSPAAPGSTSCRASFPPAPASATARRSWSPNLRTGREAGRGPGRDASGRAHQHARRAGLHREPPSARRGASSRPSARTTCASSSISTTARSWRAISRAASPSNSR